MTALIRPMGWAILTAVGLSACADLQMQPQPAPITSPQPDVNGEAIAPPADTLSWQFMLGTQSAPAGWTVEPCVNPTLLCVFENGDIAGTVEAFSQPITELEEQSMLADDQDAIVMAGLTAWVEDFYGAMERDRQTLNNDLIVTAAPPVAVTVGGRPGLHYSYVTTRTDDAMFDRSIGYVTTDGRNLYVFMAGIIPGDPTGTFMSEAQLDQFEPHLAPIMAGLTLPLP